jgi:hypothetical protein
MVTIIPPKPEYNRFYIPDNCRNGEPFENFVLQHLFPKKHYTLISSTQPLFVLKDKATGVEFCVECKYRSSVIANSFSFSKASQKEQDKKSTDRPIFLVVGLGGSCETPNQVFLMNFQHAEYVTLNKRHIHGWEIAKNTPVSSAHLWWLTAKKASA